MLWNYTSESTQNFSMTWADDIVSDNFLPHSLSSSEGGHGNENLIRTAQLRFLFTHPKSRLSSFLGISKGIS